MWVLCMLKILGLVAAVCGNFCPSACRCGIYNNLNTVDCSFKMLVTVESEMPKRTQVLDLSHNNIMEISDREFCVADLSMLHTLNVSYNKIGQIHINGFSCLQSLKVLDLSKNVIQYILPHWFWELPVLEEFYLNHNDLYSFRTQGPLFESTSLQVLNLSFCKLSYINKEAFKQMPSLRWLDLSGNLLYQLSSDVIQPLKNLEILTAVNNTWSCNNVMKKLAKYCVTHGITYTDGCKKVSGRKFERMTSKTNVTSNISSPTLFNDSFWDTTPQQNCTVNNIKHKHLLSTTMLEPRYILTVLVSFTVGITVGLILGCWIKSSSRYRHSYGRVSQRYKARKRGRSLIENCDSLGNSTPVMFRKFEVKA